MQQKTKSILAVIADFRQVTNKERITENIKVDEYMKELGKLKASLIGFATNIEHEELVQKALDIPDLNFKEYEEIFSFSDLTSSEDDQIERTTSALHFEKLDLLKKHLIEVDSILDICAIYLKATL